MKVIVDADACPRSALAICLRVGADSNIPVCTVASFNHSIDSPCHIVVGDNSQEVDLKVVNMAAKGDIVVTQDIGLAAMVLAKGASALSVVGREFIQEDMSFLLEEREAKARLRRGGGRTRGPRKREEADDIRFETSLKRIVEDKQIKHNPGLHQ